MAPRQQVISLLHGQKYALQFVHEYMGKNELNLSTLDEEEFTKAMNAITKAMLSAWADGFTAAREGVEPR